MRCTIFQIFFDPAEALEFDVFRRLSTSRSIASLSHWGAVSWRFFEKTGMTGRELLELVRASPEVDLWYCNPSPYLEGLFHSNWHHGHTTHPALLDIARAFFSAAGLPVQDLSRLHPSSHFSTANYFVGSPRFWAAYLRFVSNAIQRAETGMPREWLTKLHSSDADPRDLHHRSTYLPFIIERLLPTFLRGPGSHLHIRRYLCHREEAKLDSDLRALRELKDCAIAEQSVPLAREWMQRRNVCVRRRAPPDWWEQFAELLNPVEIIF
jgi:hypothetical protein